MKLINKQDKKLVFAVMLIIIGAFVRIFEFCAIPSGLNQDEAFSILNYGIDSAGYHNPCYFVSWGSGMNVLESYLAIPFIKILGCSVFIPLLCKLSVI